MKAVEIYDPAMCCSSGVCGPSPDDALASFAGALEKVKAAGVSVTRYNLAQEPLAFANKPEVKSALEKGGEDALPLIFVDGELYFRGVYPSADQLSKVLEIGEPKKEAISFVKVEAPKVAGASHCDSSSGCC